MISIGNSSSLPASISNIKTIFEKILKSAKLQVGPTPPRPGPMLLSIATTPVKLVVKSKLSIETNKVDIKRIKK